MKAYSSREMLKIIKADGWYEVGCDGDHHQFKHPTKKGKVTLTHPKKNIPEKTLRVSSRKPGLPSSNPNPCPQRKEVKS